MADKWLTFDCYGTIADWNTGMAGPLEKIAGRDAGRLLSAYHQAELELEAGPGWMPYREVLTAGLASAARHEGITLPDGGEAAFVLRGQGWRLAILTNCDDDLFAATRPHLPVPFDLVVTAQQVGSYKPDLGHFRAFADQTSVTPSNWIHVANSWVHDMLPAARMGLRKVWVDRDGTGHPAKLAERRVTSMRRLPEAVADVSAIVPR